MEVKFVDGIRVFKPRENAPEFVKLNIKIERDVLSKWLETQTDIINVDVKESKKGTWYVAVNDYKKAEAQPVDSESAPF